VGGGAAAPIVAVQRTRRDQRRIIRRTAANRVIPRQTLSPCTAWQILAPAAQRLRAWQCVGDPDGDQPRAQGSFGRVARLWRTGEVVALMWTVQARAQTQTGANVSAAGRVPAAPAESFRPPLSGALGRYFLISFPHREPKRGYPQRYRRGSHT